MAEVSTATITILKKLNNGQTLRMSHAQRAWTTDQASVKFETAIQMNKDGVIEFYEVPGTPWYLGDYRISEVGKRVLAEKASGLNVERPGII